MAKTARGLVAALLARQEKIAEDALTTTNETWHSYHKDRCATRNRLVQVSVDALHDEVTTLSMLRKIYGTMDGPEEMEESSDE